MPQQEGPPVGNQHIRPSRSTQLLAWTGEVSGTGRAPRLSPAWMSFRQAQGRTGTAATGRRATTTPRDGPSHATDPAAKPSSQRETEFPSGTGSAGKNGQIPAYPRVRRRRSLVSAMRLLPVKSSGYTNSTISSPLERRPMAYPTVPRGNPESSNRSLIT
jgi:hypothetical protein